MATDADRSRWIYEHLAKSGYSRYLREWHEDGEGWRGVVDLAVVPLLQVDERFTCWGWFDWALHTDVGPCLIGFRSLTGRLGPRSMQWVIARVPGALEGPCWLDTDRFNPDQDIVNQVGHLGLEVLWPRLRSAGAWLVRRFTGGDRAEGVLEVEDVLAERGGVGGDAPGVAGARGPAADGMGGPRARGAGGPEHPPAVCDEAAGGGGVAVSDQPVITLPPINFGGLGIRSASGLDLSPTTQQAIDNALAAVPPGHGTAILEVGLKAVRALVAVRKPTTVFGQSAEWTIGAYVGKPYSGTVDAGIRATLSF